MREVTATVLLLLSSGAAGCLASSGPGGTGQSETRLEEVRFRVYRGARLVASGEMASVAYRRDTGDLGAEEVAVAFPEEGTRVRAPRARANAASRDLLAEGGVRAERGLEVATTEQARYDPDDRRVHGGWPISISGPGYHLGGPGFILDPASGRLEIRGGTRLKAWGGVR